MPTHPAFNDRVDLIIGGEMLIAKLPLPRLRIRVSFGVGKVLFGNFSEVLMLERVKEETVERRQSRNEMEVGSYN